MIYIGIDPGVNTGFAVWNKRDKKFNEVSTRSIVDAMKNMSATKDFYGAKNITVVIEDARKRKWFGNAGREKLQGAGSIKRDCSIWQEYLQMIDVPFRMVEPKNNRTKLNAQQFRLLTGWKGKTSEHSRDAAMLVFGI